VPLAELPAACQAGPDASVGAETWVLWFLSYLIRSHTATLAALLRTDEVFTPSEEVQLLKARVEYIYTAAISRGTWLCRSNADQSGGEAPYDLVRVVWEASSIRQISLLVTGAGCLSNPAPGTRGGARWPSLLWRHRQLRGGRARTSPGTSPSNSPGTSPSTPPGKSSTTSHAPQTSVGGPVQRRFFWYLSRPPPW